MQLILPFRASVVARLTIHSFAWCLNQVDRFSLAHISAVRIPSSCFDLSQVACLSRNIFIFFRPLLANPSLLAWSDFSSALECILRSYRNAALAGTRFPLTQLIDIAKAGSLNSCYSTYWTYCLDGSIWASLASDAKRRRGTTTATTGTVAFLVSHWPLPHRMWTTLPAGPGESYNVATVSFVNFEISVLTYTLWTSSGTE